MQMETNLRVRCWWVKRRIIFVSQEEKEDVLCCRNWGLESAQERQQPHPIVLVDVVLFTVQQYNVFVLLKVNKWSLLLRNAQERLEMFPRRHWWHRLSFCRRSNADRVVMVESLSETVQKLQTEQGFTPQAADLAPRVHFVYLSHVWLV